MSQIVYKLKHKPTGLFYDPKGCTNNASEIGKVFNRKPPRQNFWGVTNSIKKEMGFLVGYQETPLEEWEVVEFELIECKPEVVGKPLSKYGDLMTMEEFVEHMELGGLTSDDGSGRYSDGERVYGYIDHYNPDRNYSHVEWYNV